MRQLSWLHISDLHIKSEGDSFSQQEACRALTRHIAVVKRVSSPPIGALTDCFSAIRGGQFSALNNRTGFARCGSSCGRRRPGMPGAGSTCRRRSRSCREQGAGEMKRPGRVRKRKESKHLTISARNAEWKEARAKADRRGLSIARYVKTLMDRDVLTAEE